jgi:hypothetical protein
MPAMGGGHRRRCCRLGVVGGYSSSGTMARVPAEAAEVHSTIKPGVRLETLTSLRTPKFTSDRRSRARDGEA